MPTQDEVRIDQGLTQYMEAFPLEQRFIGTQFLPELPVKLSSDIYYKLDPTREGQRTPIDDYRRPTAEAKEVDWATSTARYSCQNHALMAYLADEVRNNANTPLANELNHVAFLRGKLELGRELLIKTAMDAAVTQTSDLAAAKWSDPVNGDPLVAVSAAIKTVQDAIGVKPNVMGMDDQVFMALKDHPDMVARVQYGGSNAAPAVVDASAIAKVFGLERLEVADCAYNSAQDGQTASMSRVWGSTVYLAYVPRMPAIRTMSFGYCFMWDQPGSQNGWIVSTWRAASRKSDAYQIDVAYDPLLIAAGAAYKFTTVI